jgi:hypothetical protein
MTCKANKLEELKTEEKQRFVQGDNSKNIGQRIFWKLGASASHYHAILANLYKPYI